MRWLRRMLSGGPRQDRSPSGPQLVHVALGPVQGFVAQARRTRDLWAGSFLLAWLTGVAIRATPRRDTRILLPHAKHNPLVEAADKGEAAPYRPSLPNHFVAEVPADFDPDACVEAVQAAWVGLADEVWKTFVEPVANTGQGAADIWRRQIGAADGRPPFWEVSWVRLPVDTGAEDCGLIAALDAMERRKLWRSWPSRAAEPGDMCTLMADWQELSGCSRMQSRKEQDAFWANLRKCVGKKLGHEEVIDLREGERLCALALVKRLFPLLPPEKLERLIGFPVPRSEVAHNGRILAGYRPSTSYLAAAHWLARARRHAPTQCDAMAAVADKASRALARAERYNRLGLLAENHSFGWLDGRLFFEGAYEAETELKRLTPEVKGDLLRSLRRITSTEIKAPSPGDDLEDSGIETVGAPSPYYAILCMDGDEAGKLVSTHGLELPPCLADFAGRADEIVARHHGELVYASGDDLMALLPLEDVLDTALELRGAWHDTVAAKVGAATISAGVTFAHHQVSLRMALEETRALVNDVAKDANGRDSIAVSVYGRNGRSVLWASTWDKAGEPDDGAIVRGLARLAGDDPAGPSVFSANRLVYGVKERLSAFFVGPGASRTDVLGASGIPTLHADEVKSLVRALGGRRAAGLGEPELDALLDILRPHHREGAHTKRMDAPLQLDALLLLRFLATHWTRMGDDDDARAQAA